MHRGIKLVNCWIILSTMGSGAFVQSRDFKDGDCCRMACIALCRAFFAFTLMHGGKNKYFVFFALNK